MFLQKYFEFPIPFSKALKSIFQLSCGCLLCRHHFLRPPFTSLFYCFLHNISMFHTSYQSENHDIDRVLSYITFVSDSLGRRPIYLFFHALYTLVNLGLAVHKRSYAGLLILRALQRFGASSVLAIAFGVIADVWPPAKRGSAPKPTQGAANLAVCVGHRSWRMDCVS